MWILIEEPQTSSSSLQSWNLENIVFCVFVFFKEKLLLLKYF